MSVLGWAKNEVELACKNEMRENGSNDWDYACECYKSALKAYEALFDDSHSGCSFHITANILKRLLDEKPLTEIEDTPENWTEVDGFSDGSKHYQCKRCPSIFKTVRSDGSVEFSDSNRFTVVDKNTNCSYSFGLVDKILNKQFPIKFPYYPDKNKIVYAEDFCVDPENGDFDTYGIFEIKEFGKSTTINRFFKWSTDDDDWEEVSEDEYNDRKRKLYSNNLNEV